MKHDAAADGSRVRHWNAGALGTGAVPAVQNLPVRLAVEQNEPAEADALLDRIERHRVDVVLVELRQPGFHLP